MQANAFTTPLRERPVPVPGPLQPDPPGPGPERRPDRLVQAAVIRDVTQGIVPHRQNTTGTIPFNLMKLETLVWVIQNVDYLETVVRRERQGTSHGLSIKVTRGLYYRPSTFRSRPIEWDETVHADTGLLGLTTKHIYFAGSRKKFRFRYDRIVSFDLYDDGFGIIRDAQTAKPQIFRTGTAGSPTTSRLTRFFRRRPLVG